MNLALDKRVCGAQMMKADSMDVLAEERDREVRNILTSIADLAQIMKDLSTLVIDQGTVLDRIDYNMEQARRLCDLLVTALLAGSSAPACLPVIMWHVMAQAAQLRVAAHCLACSSEPAASADVADR